MRNKIIGAVAVALFSSVSATALHAQLVEPTIAPDSPAFPAQGEITFVKRADILEYRALPGYQEPDWVTTNFVDTGKLPLYLTLTTLIPVTASSTFFLTFVVLVIVALGWAQLSREVRSKTMALAHIDYVRAAIAVGASDRRIILRHILPNVLSHVIVAVTLGIPTIILLESFLGFLGFAVKPPLISWGLMLQDAGAFSVLGSYPWILSPVGFVLITVFAFNALGDGLRDAIDPY